MLEHSGEALAVLVGFWRFVLSRNYRVRKNHEWREARQSVGGVLIVALEIVAAVVIGLGLPAVIATLVAAAL